MHSNNLSKGCVCRLKHHCSGPCTHIMVKRVDLSGWGTAF
ncbi:uncharacterized protein J3R85_017132 [Psidium guajava]|nr:uncharacterized protein J3R85_017132 [Psidium guajava]